MGMSCRFQPGLVPQWTGAASPLPLEQRGREASLVLSGAEEFAHAVQRLGQFPKLHLPGPVQTLAPLTTLLYDTRKPAGSLSKQHLSTCSL